MLLFTLVTRLLATFTFIVTAGALVLLAALATSGGRERIHDAFVGRVRHPLAWAWLLAAAAMSGSLYFSEVVGFAPCALCWYQRIAMYPLVVLLAVAWWVDEASAWRFVLPLPVIGLLISLYHVAIQLRPSLEVTSCTGSVPCTARYLSVFGFVSIPVMAGSAFLGIIALMLAVRTATPSDAPDAPDAD